MAMEDWLHPLLAAYIGSPQWVKHAIGRGYARLPLRLRRGRHYARFVPEAPLRGAPATALALRKLAATLQWALSNVPAYQPYRELLAQRLEPLELLRQLPLVSKADINHDLTRFLANGIGSHRRLKTLTGGSSATPMLFYLQKGVSRAKEYAFMDDFHRRVGLSDDDVVLTLRGRPVPGSDRIPPRLWMYEPIKKQLILSSHHLDHTAMPQHVATIRAWRPRFIQAYPSSLYPLARWLREHPAAEATAQVQAIMLYSENVLDDQLALMREVFDCPIFKHYGQSERVLMAASMPDDERYFFWPQYGHLELIDEAGRPVTRPGVLGEIVGTGFDNHVMPFIRYRTGDMAVLSDRPHPLLPGFAAVERIEGREQEFIVCDDGRLISLNALSMGMADAGDMIGMEAMQYEQYRPGELTLKVVCARELSDGAGERLAQVVARNSDGGCRAKVVVQKEIACTPRGKRPMMVQHLELHHGPAPLSPTPGVDVCRCFK